MSFSFNLVDERWIPCVRADGRRDELSLREVLAQAHTLREILADTPLETAALHRLLLAILHRNFGPADRAAWRKLWQRRKSGFDMQPLDEYLAKWRHKFDLFDEKQPFYQLLDPRTSEKPIISMILQSASGNNGTLFDHSTESADVALSPSQAALALIVSQTFGIGGLSGLPEKFTDAPCAKGIIFLAKGETVFETLLLNLVKYGDEDPIPNEEDDCPAWELDNPVRFVRETPKGYLDYLTWYNRRVWLIPEQEGKSIIVKRMHWAPALRLAATDVDPHKQYIPDETEGWRILCFQSDRALWRDSSTMLQMSSKDRPPKAVRWLSDLVQRGILDMERQYKLMALGMAKDRASIEFFRHEDLPLLPKYLAEQKPVEALTAALALAESIAKDLRVATTTLARLLFKPGLGEKEIRQPMGKEERERVRSLSDSWNASSIYWSCLEPHFYTLVTGLPNEAETAMQTWRDHLRRAANAAFDYAESCAGSDLRSQRACAKARDFFELHLNIALKVTDPNQTQEETLDE